MQAVKKFDPDKGFRLTRTQCGGSKLQSGICFKIMEFSQNGDYYRSKKTFF